jgi:hypothetical protein
MSDRRDDTTLSSTVDSVATSPSWVAAQLLDDVENVEVRIFDDVDNDQADRGIANRKQINIDASIDLCIE